MVIKISSKQTKNTDNLREKQASSMYILRKQSINCSFVSCSWHKRLIYLYIFHISYISHFTCIPPLFHYCRQSRVHSICIYIYKITNQSHTNAVCIVMCPSDTLFLYYSGRVGKYKDTADYENLHLCVN
jgi:hypothetical protein